MTSKYDLERAYFDNLRWEPAGLDPEVVRDLGGAVNGDDFDRQVQAGIEAKKVLEAAQHTKRELGSVAFTCADCMIELPPGTGCSHIRIGKRGKPYTY